MLWCSSTVTADWVGSRRAPRSRGLGVSVAAPPPAPPSRNVASTFVSIFFGKAFTSSRNVRLLSIPDALSARCGLNSFTSLVKRLVTSMTADLSFPQALTGNTLMIGATLVPSTASFTESLTSARME